MLCGDNLGYSCPRFKKLLFSNEPDVTIYNLHGSSIQELILFLSLVKLFVLYENFCLFNISLTTLNAYIITRYINHYNTL